MGHLHSTPPPPSLPPLPVTLSPAAVLSYAISASYSTVAATRFVGVIGLFASAARTRFIEHVVLSLDSLDIGFRSFCCT